MCRPIFAAVCLVLGLTVPICPAAAAELLVGGSTVSITPAEPVALQGQFYLRITDKVETPCTANVIALESRGGGRALDAAVMVTCDLAGIPDEALRLIREKVHQRLPELDVMKIFLNATHTHTAPTVMEGAYVLPATGVMQVKAYHEFLAGRVAEAIEKAWKGRTPGSVTWGLGHAVVAYNRRTVYADGKRQMYGRTDSPKFRNLEGYEDHDVDALFFWNAAGGMVGVAITVACPTQEVENGSAVNADFWHPAREGLRKRFGDGLAVLSWVGAAGDQSPHLMYRKAADERMRNLRGLMRLDEIARRILRAVDEAYDTVKDDRHADVPLVHKVEKLSLPARLVTEAECANAQKECDTIAAQIAKNPKMADQVAARMRWYRRTIDRYNSQAKEPRPVCGIELHVVRIGDAVVCTNPFELFTDYGIRVKARSKATQTFLVQLAGELGYLPTEKAVAGGGYSAVVESSQVGPEGGQILVDRTVELIQSAW